MLAEARGLRIEQVPTPVRAVGSDVVVVGRIRNDPAADDRLALFLICDNLRKGAALNGVPRPSQLRSSEPRSVGRGCRNDGICVASVHTLYR